MAGRLGNRARFAIAYLMLGAAVGAGLGALIVLLQRPAPGPPPPWSVWRPGATSVLDREVQIANHVGAAYKLPSGDQLTYVRVGGPANGKSLRAIVIPTTPKPQTLGDFQTYDWSKSVVYVLCGTGSNCKIGEGDPTKARGTVIRREALELALYTMRYNEIDNVLVFVPPGPKQKKLSSGLFFKRNDLESHLSKPLRTTLPQGQAPLPGKIASGEQQTVDQLTGSNLYTYVGILPANGYGNVLAIQPTG
ncbi:MAG TPA: hypothetical protein VH297_12190 [Gaiellaceae bacterium]